MRSTMPKLLHPLCGRPMIGWAVAAARDAGAGKIVVVDSPGRPLGGRARRRGRAGRPGSSRAARPTRVRRPRSTSIATRPSSCSTATCRWSAPRRRALVASARADSGAAATIADGDADGPERLRTRRPRRRTARSSGSSRPRPGDATDRGARDPRGQHRHVRLRRRRAADGAGAGRPDNAQGEYYLPDVLPVLRAHGRTVDGARARRCRGDARRQRPRPAGRRCAPWPSARSTSGTCCAGVTIVDPAATVIDFERGDRATTR